MEVSSGSVSSGTLSSTEVPRGRWNLEAVWLKRPIMLAAGDGADGGEVGACARMRGGSN